MNYAATLWIIGVLCLMAALFGKAIKVAGNSLPELAGRGARVVLSVVGVVAIGLGALVFIVPPRSTNPPSASSSSSTSATPPAPTTTTAATAAPATSASTDPAIRWQGSIQIQQAYGINLDRTPPSQGGPALLNYQGGASNAVQPGAGVLVAEWTDDKAPGRADCASWLVTHATDSVQGIQPGMVLCVRTGADRYARLQVTKVDTGSDLIEADTVIWNE